MTARLDPGSGSAPIGEDDLQAYVDGRLDPGRRREVEAYLAGHPEAVERVEAYRRQNIGLHALFDRQLDQSAPAALERLRCELEAAVARGWRVGRMAAPLALVLGIGAIGCWWAFGPQAHRRATARPQSRVSRSRRATPCTIRPG